MNILKKATVFKCKLPVAAELSACLSKMAFQPILETMASSSGFIDTYDQMVLEVAGGFVVTLRHDEKIMPKSALKRIFEERADAILEETEEESLTKQQADSLRDTIYSETLKTALVKTTIVRGFYYAEDNMFAVETTNKTLASIFTDRIIRAVGSVEFVTVHLSDAVGSLTKRLGEYVDGDWDCAPFGSFSMGSYVHLKGSDDSITVKHDDMACACDALSEAIRAEMKVSKIELHHNQVSFKLDQKFVLSGIAYEHDEDREDEDFMTAAEIWVNEAGIRLLQVAAVVRDLLVMFEYKQPELLDPEIQEQFSGQGFQ